VNTIDLRRIAISGLAAACIGVLSAPALADPSPSPASPSPAAGSSSAAAPALVVAPEDAKVGTLAHTVYEQVRAGSVDRTKLAPVVATAFTPAVESTLAAQLGALGDPVWTYQGYRPTSSGGRTHVYLLAYKQVTLRMLFGVDSAGLVSTLLFQSVKAP
jgi:hypothetical protein